MRLKLDDKKGNFLILKNLIRKEYKILLAGHNGMAGSAILRALKKEGIKILFTIVEIK